MSQESGARSQGARNRLAASIGFLDRLFHAGRDGFLAGWTDARPEAYATSGKPWEKQAGTACLLVSKASRLTRLNQASISHLSRMRGRRTKPPKRTGMLGADIGRWHFGLSRLGPSPDTVPKIMREFSGRQSAIGRDMKTDREVWQTRQAAIRTENVQIGRDRRS
jgi:hypothetical protein